MVETWIRLANPAAEFTRGQSGDAFERAMEVALVGEAQSERDLCDRRIPIREFRSRCVNPSAAYELTDGASVSPPEDTCDMHRMQAGDRGNVAQTDRFRKASSQRVLHPAEPERSQSVRNRLTSRRGQQLEKQRLCRQRGNVIPLRELAIQACDDRSCGPTNLSRRMHRDSSGESGGSEARGHLDEKVPVLLAVILRMRLSGRIKHQIACAPFKEPTLEEFGVTAARHKTEMSILMPMEWKSLALLVVRFAEIKRGR